jgi:CheY-like chemotaxis protein
MTKPVLTGKRVLVLEDDPLIAMMIVDILEQAGCTVTGPAYDEAQALALAAERNIDVAVLDVHLGQNTTSAKVAEVLAGLEIPFIFATGYARNCSQIRGRPAVNKPYNASEVIAALISALSIDLSIDKRGLRL